MKNGSLPNPDERAAVLSARRGQKMARSAHAFVRGSTRTFYEWLEVQKSRSLPDGPPVWICGDCHFGNLGPLSDSKGRVEIQIRDLDHTVIGNPAHDLIRLGLSLATAARGCDLPGITTAKILEQMIEGYERALAKKDDKSEKRPEAVGIGMKRAVRRSWKTLAKERIENAKPTIPLGETFWPLSKSESNGIDELFKREDVRKLATLLRSRKNDADVEVLDAAYWVKGCSSLGRLRYAVLLRVGKNAKSQLCFMDVKEAVAAAAPRYPKSSMPKNNGARVVEGARQLSAFLGDRMLSAQLLDREVVLRELLPQDMKLDLDHLARAETMEVARFLAGVVGKGHARQMDVSARQRWQKELARYRSKSLDAPSWLWSSVVALVARHEVAYLEHCRAIAGATSTSN
jgi:uncharacterized protein (DUF2252 family)